MSIEKLNLKTGDLVTESHFDIIDNNFQDYKDNKTEILNTLDSHTSQLNEATKYRNAKDPIYVETYEGSGETTHPHVIYIDKGWNGYKYWMAHTPYPKSNNAYENPCIAVSNDGIIFTTPTGLTNPIDIPTNEQFTAGYHMSDTHLLIKDNKLECWYRLNVNGGIEQLLRKTSTDGINWSAREVVYELTDGNTCLSPALIFEDGKYKMWYVKSALEVNYVESNTGTIGTWTTPTKVNLSYRDNEPSSIPWHLNIYTENGVYYLILCVTTTDNKKRLMIGKATDCSNFKDMHTLILPTTIPSGKWDNMYIYRSSLVKVKDAYRLYYPGWNYDNVWGIGLLEGDSIESLQDTGKSKELNLMKGGHLKDDEIKLLNLGLYGALIKLIGKGKIKITDDKENLGSLLLSVLELAGGGHFNDTELKFLNPGIAGARLKLTGANELSVRDDKDIAYGNLILNMLKLANGGYLSDTELKFFNAGVAASKFKLTAPNEISIIDEKNVENGVLKVSSVTFWGNCKNTEGAIRYDADRKKHMAYDGTTWHDLY